MKKLILVLTLFVTSILAEAYQVTGQVTEVTDTKIVVMKGKEKFEIALTAPTTVKVGDKVKVEYSMTASDVMKK